MPPVVPETLTVLLPTRVVVEASVGEQYVDLRCSRCGLLMLAAVSGNGTGLRMGGVSVSNAELDARVGAAQATQLAPCPRCGHRSRAALVKVLLVGASVGAFAALAAGLAAAEQFRGPVPGVEVGVQVGVATFLIVVATTTALKLRSVRRRVRFLREAR